MSKLDLTIENMKITKVKPTEYPKVFDSPAKCAHFSSFRGCRLVWSRLVDLGSIDPGSNPGSPINKRKRIDSSGS
jgi:hypothetical protein